MGLLDGLEVFGMTTETVDDLFGTKKKTENKGETTQAAAPEVKEEDLLLAKSVQCPICDHEFRILTPKSGRIRRLESDRDLRPNCVGIDILKYNVICCPKCGYAALTQNDWFKNILRTQKDMIRKGVTERFDPSSVEAAYGEDVNKWNYGISIALHKLSLYNCVVKNAKNSEKAYNCLVLAWLNRGRAEEMEAKGEEPERIQKIRSMEEEYYRNAYEGLMKAVSEETPPICGMSEHMMNYLLAIMSDKFGKLETASKIVASIITSSTADRKIKDKARDLKEELLIKIKEKNEGQN